MASVDDMLTAARSELDYKEDPPDSNLTKFAAEAGHLNGRAWCATFEVALANRVGLVLPPGANTASVYLNLAAYRAAGQSPTDPQPGDFAHFSIGSGHTGIVESVQYATITTIDGNTIPDGQTGDQANGGEVCRKTRSKQIVAGYGRPSYSSPEDIMQRVIATVTDPAAEVTFKGLDGVTDVAVTLSSLVGIVGLGGQVFVTTETLDGHLLVSAPGRYQLALS